MFLNRGFLPIDMHCRLNRLNSATMDNSHDDGFVTATQHGQRFARTDLDWDIALVFL